MDVGSPKLQEVMRGGRNGPSSTGGGPLNDTCVNAEFETTCSA